MSKFTLGLILACISWLPIDLGPMFSKTYPQYGYEILCVVAGASLIFIAGLWLIVLGVKEDFGDARKS